MHAPTLRILGYESRPPLLRVIRLAEAGIEPAPVSLDQPDAIDLCIRLDGWMALQAGVTFWRVGNQLVHGALRLGEGRAAMPSLDRQGLWIDESPTAGPDAGTVSRFAEYDGEGSARRSVVYPRKIRLVTEQPEGLVISDPESGAIGLLAWDTDHITRLTQADAVVAAGHRRLVLDSDYHLSVFDLGTGDSRMIQQPDGREWQLHGLSLSHDEGWCAGALIPALDDDPLAGVKAVVKSVAAGKAAPVSTDSFQLALAATSSGAVRLTDEIIEGQLVSLVWSADGGYVVFSSTQRELYWADVQADQLQPHRVEFGTDAPSPRADISDLVA
jgi:hypothetical protein